MPDFRLPDLGEGLTSAEIVRWLVAEGETIAVDQPVVEVETAKATVEVPAPFAGVVTRLHGDVGQIVDVGAPLISVDSAAFNDSGVVTPEAAPSSESGRVLVGYGTSTPVRRERRRRMERSIQRPEPAAEPAAAPAAANGHPVISPLVRKLARDHGIDVAALDGSGPRGTVLRRDVEQALAVGPEPAAVAEPGVDRRRIPLTGVRRLAADRLSRSRREIPEATVWVDVDATELLAARIALNAAQPDEPVSLLALLARFAVLGLRRYPELNARVEDDAVVLLDDIHLGFAAQTDRGLLVPVVRDAHRLTTRELSARLATHTSAARGGSLAPGDLTGGTFTVNNYGVFGVDGSAAIINFPEVAILGMGRIIDRPWAREGAVVLRKLTQLTLAFDHRACDGGVAGGFLRFVADCVEAPVVALGDA
ncbi:MAG: dihydrolipoamide acetyltransferase family protein [Actinomycetota bacterium]